MDLSRFFFFAKDHSELRNLCRLWQEVKGYFRTLQLNPASKMAKPQSLVFILRHKGLNSLKFGSVHWPKSWLCSFSTGLVQNNLRLVAKYLFALPAWTGLGILSLPSWIILFHKLINQSTKEGLFRISTNPTLIGRTGLLDFVPLFSHLMLIVTICSIFLTCIPAFGFSMRCKMLPQHLNLSWTAMWTDVILFTTLNLRDTKPVLLVCWLSTITQYMLFHDTWLWNVKPSTLLFLPDWSFSSVDARLISFRLHTPKGQH